MSDTVQKLRDAKRRYKTEAVQARRKIKTVSEGLRKTLKTLEELVTEYDDPEMHQALSEVKKYIPSIQGVCLDSDEDEDKHVIEADENAPDMIWVEVFDRVLNKTVKKQVPNPRKQIRKFNIPDRIR